MNYSTIMNKLIKKITIISVLITVAYPAHDFIRDFASNRIARVQDTNYNFSRYLRS
ncbi:hypothetical protein [Geminocystis sp.]|uniref:hypothetical protein n=1 Tax=Geminocystis sp. TaxID=2664100 RepID=UPI003592FACE